MNQKNIASTILTVVIASGLIIGGAYAYQNLTDKNEHNQPEQNTPHNQEPQNNIPSDWKTTTSQAVGVTVSHPQDVTARDDENGLTFYKWGPTQAEGTEVYDGILISFDKAPLQGKTFREAAEAEVEEWKIHGEIVEPLKTTTLAGQNAYTFVGSGLGKYTIYFIELENNSYLRVSTFVEDPASQNFHATADTILRSIKID